MFSFQHKKNSPINEDPTINIKFKGDDILNLLKLVLFVFVAAFFMLVLPAGQETLYAGDEEDICFFWAFGAMVGPENNRHLMPVVQDAELRSGDQIKMLIGIEKKCFVYLFFENEKGEILLLFPSAFNQFDCSFSPKIYYIPDGEMWFELDEDVGLEKFYLLASLKRLASIERLYSDYSTASSSQKKATAKRLLKSIREKLKAHLTLGVSAERALNIGGRVRGLAKSTRSGPSIESIAKEICATDFYCKTYTIDHKKKK